MTLTNAIMEAGSKDRPPMPSHGIYVQWKSKITTSKNSSESYENVGPKKQALIDVEDEAIQIILTRIDNDIYSTVYACDSAKVRRLKQHQNEVNELRAKTLARTANQLELVATTHRNGPTYGTKPLEKIQSNDEYNGFATDQQHTEQPESINDTYMVDKDDKYVTSNSSNMSSNEREVDQDAGKNNDEHELD
ncbi:hypothetical protein Tco_0937227 [Tanacetum coccineum]|uniref:Uncharacterized protein n=1 Tax=Tanacetum coccineum TaxID=301880 RepID=A0ABQ5DEH9_9ASTR